MAEGAPAAKGPLDRRGSFRVIYAAILVYVLLCVATLASAKALLQRHFHDAIASAVAVSPAQGRVTPQISARVTRVLRESRWVRWGGVQARAIVLAADGRTPLFLEGLPVALPLRDGALDPFDEADRLLPASSEVMIALPPDSLLAGAIFVGYGCLLIPALFVHQRRAARREAALFASALAARDAAAERARSIQGELENLRSRLAYVEPAEREHAAEIDALQRERAGLVAKLRELSEREARLRDDLARTSSVARDQQALEDLLDEAMQDLGLKEREIETLEERLRRASRAPTGGAARAAEALGRRFEALYPNLEVEPRALRDLAALGDETLRLRAEEALKRLDVDPASAAVRRKVGGLPAGLAIFELGFAGKGRIYYRRGAARPFRILAVGGKASQKTDLEYLSRLPTE
jgi:hypothetical protein